MSDSNATRTAGDTGPAIVPAAPAEWYPLSSGQQALWLVAQAGASHAAYTIPATYELKGTLDTGALRVAVELVQSRHESLRTAIGELDGVPMQRVVEEPVIEWRFEAIEDAGDCERRVRDFIALDFDLSAGRLLRALLIERSTTEHLLVVSAHHIAIDGWSLTLLIDEVVTAYNAFALGGRPALPALPIQYRDYSCWQRRLVEEEGLEESRRYWRQALDGALEPLELPSDRPRPPVRSFRGARTRRVIAPASLDALKALCREERVTLYAGLCAMLRALFFRYTGQRDFVLGTSALGRPVPELYDQIGYYVNTLALRDTITPAMTFRDLLLAVQRTLRTGLQHQDYPFDRVVRDAGAATDINRTPFFEVMVLLDQGWGDPTVEMDGVEIRQVDAPTSHAKMDLSLFFQETPAGLKVIVEYSTDIFDPDRIDRLVEHFETLMSAAVGSPGHTVDRLPLLPAHERERVLVEFNDTGTGYELDAPVHHLFERQVRRTPERVATVDEHEALTFARLNARANALAWKLRDDHGVRPGTLVALFLDRSVDMTAAILGVLKAGGAYLPIAVEDPAERVVAILEDSGSEVLVVRAAGPGALPGGCAVVDIRSLWPQFRTDDPPPLAGPSDPIYCIYTSGSTGRPNGVLIEHRAVVNRLRWMIDDLGLDETDVILQKTPYVFDVSVWELLLPGVIGARQVMLRPGGQADPAAIHGAIERHGVTTIHFVPSMLSQYLAAMDDGFRGVRHCVCSGEQLDGGLARRFLAATRSSRTGLSNYYGPTEATVDVSALRVEVGLDPITIGRPAPNNRLYVLGEADEPCPIGVTGELCIGGLQVGRGYLNRQELTAERFAPDPFRPDGRMYRTGDLAQWRPNGEVLLLGRRDGQVKVRGFRIELGEIEHVLRNQPGVERAVVLLQRNAAGGEFLYAYVEGAALPPPDQLREGLASRLPEHMVPSHYVLLDAVPVTRNGKVDRKALAALAAGARAASRQYVPHRTEVEEQLLCLWESLLPPGRIGVTDDFFVVGGNSLSALQLSSRISRSFGIPMTVASIFQHRTITDQARLIAGSRTTPPSAGRVPRPRPRPRSSWHVLSFAQERIWFLHMLDPASAAYNIRLLARLRGPLDADVLRRAVHSLVARQEMLRVTFVNAGERPFQVPHTDLPVPFHVRDLTETAADAARAMVRREVQEADARPFRLQEETPLRIVLFRLSPTEHELLVVLHHIAGDGWSLRLLLRELSILYLRELDASRAALPDLPLQYIDYAEAVRHSDQQQAVEDDLRYWSERLAGCPSLELPTDVPGQAPARPSSGRESATVSPATCRALRHLADGNASTLSEITMAALNLVLSRLSDQQDLVVGFPVANRQSVELEGIVGLFLNTLVLRTDLSGRPTFTDLLRRVSAGVREAYEHQAAPFELVVERLNPARHVHRTPVFDVLLNYLGDLREEVAIEGVSVEFDDQLFEPEAKFPLAFYVKEEAGGGMRIELLYRADLFSASRAEMMVRQLAHALRQVAESPDDPIATCSLTPPGTGVVIADLDCQLPAPDHPPVTELIAAHAATSSDRIAIVQGPNAITYRELADRSEAVARLLRAAGHGPGDVIGMTGPRSIGFVSGMLGVLRSGAAVLPVDLALPEARRQHLLAIGSPKAFVRAEDGVSAEGDPIASGLHTVRVDARTGLPLNAPPDGLSQTALPPVSPRSPAYLFFTSGTTGAPRGVLGWHGALSHFLLWQSRSFGIEQEDRCAQTTNVSFDVMLRDTFLALVSGGALVIPEAPDEMGGRSIFRWLERERITVLHAVPTVLQSWLLDAPAGSRLPCLRWTFLAGEPLKASLVERFRSTCSEGGEIVNLYGPTETTLAKFAYRVPLGPLPHVLPVGSPLPQCQAFVMRDGVLCGVGEPGEIIIRTPFRTLGYLDDPEATGAAFLRNPRRNDDDDLLYRTGDIGRFRPDGLLEVVGRRDHEVKISGVRVQPAEVENALGRHPLVSTSIVVGHRDAVDEIHLVAYVVPRMANPDLGDRLRAHLSHLLPRAMVPVEYVLVDRIPTTPNGKPDRGALPAPSFSRHSPRVASEAPRTTAERAISDVWEAVLDRPEPGVNDNFFDLGGTSLKLLRLHALLDERFPRTIRVAQLFTHPTIAMQAGLVEPGHPDAGDGVIEHEL